MLNAPPALLHLENRRIFAPDGRSVSISDVALHSLHVENQHQIMSTASIMSYDSPPPFAAQFAEVEVDSETGQVRVVKMVSAVDCGKAINPATAEGQIEGGATQAPNSKVAPFDNLTVRQAFAEATDRDSIAN